MSETTELTITISFPGGKRVNAEINNFTIKTDQPVKYGGEGSAPTPFDFFLASIGTCAGIFVLSFCQERKIPTEQLSLVQHLVYKTRGNGKVFLDTIVLEIVVPPDFPKKYHKALIKVADQCSVKKMILNPPKFEVKTTVKA
jgi:ribosomal protein S12 methylthiotransferase accessory factor